MKIVVKRLQKIYESATLGLDEKMHKGDL
jgi:hypothetical protein